MSEPNGGLIAGRYRLMDVIGHGGMGTVWRAVDASLDRPVAVKELRLPPELDPRERDVRCKRIVREAMTAARLSHPSVATVYDVVTEDGRPWLVMELVRARPLDRVVAEDGPLPPERATRIGKQVLSALVAAHAAGVLHRDVKPSNVLLTDRGRAVLTDFGIATFAGDVSLTRTGQVVGSPSFMPPERARGRSATPAADLWALGATLFMAVEGRPPFERETAIATLSALVGEEPPEAVHAGALRPVIARLLSRDPQARPDAAQAALLLSQAAAAQRRRPVPATVPAAPAAPAMPRSAMPMAPGAAGSAIRSAGAAPAGAGTRAPGARLRTGGRRAVWLSGALAVVLIAGGITALVALRGHDPDTGSADQVGDTRHAVGAGTVRRSASPTRAARGQRLVRMVSGPPGTRYGVPRTWHDRRRSGDNYYYYAPGHRAYLQIAWTDHPRRDAAADWRRQARLRGPHFTGYHQIGIHAIDYRHYPTAAVWDFTWRRGDTTVRVADRGFTTDAHHGYAILFSAPQRDWAALRRVRQAVYASFRAPR